MTKYEMNPCRLVGNNYEKCEESAPDIATWSVYRRNDGGPAEHVSDHATKAEAQAALERLNASAL